MLTILARADNYRKFRVKACHGNILGMAFQRLYASLVLVIPDFDNSRDKFLVISRRRTMTVGQDILVIGTTN